MRLEQSQIGYIRIINKCLPVIAEKLKLKFRKQAIAIEQND